MSSLFDIDKAIKEALEGGEKIDGVRLVEKQNLSVK